MRRRSECPDRVIDGCDDGLCATDGMPLTADAPLQRGELAKSATCRSSDGYAFKSNGREKWVQMPANIVTTTVRAAEVLVAVQHAASLLQEGRKRAKVIRGTRINSHYGL